MSEEIKYYGKPIRARLLNASKQENLYHWVQNDDTLLGGVEAERIAMDKLHERLVRDYHPVSHWLYSHFHLSWHNSIDRMLFRMLDIMEFCSVY